jgi:type I restriction enzyme M protein
MVRLSLVNLYLHGFQDPKIYEYDTLTSEERWDETVDVVLANPPFMTPKGGIRPHKRFSVQANRSELLFVDYIAEHLNPGGRAGVIVPEGIIFQSSNAYKALRKMLVGDYLWAVVSLPAGVFQPYSGVKTSILLMDKTKAKQNDSILFVKVENEGTDLGAKRSSIEGSDLPMALSDLKAFLNNNEIQSDISIEIKKEDILAEKDYSLTASRYIESQNILSDYESVRLGKYIEDSKDRSEEQITEVWSVSNKMGFIESKKYFNINVPSKNISNYKMIMPNYFAYNPSRINVGSLAFNDSENIGCVSPMYVVFNVSDTRLNNQYLLQLLKSMQFNDFVNENAQGGVRQQLKFESLCDFQVPLPPLSVQEEIVAEIDGYQKIIDGARQVVDNYKPTIKIDPNWEMVKLEEVCSKITDGTHDTPKQVDEGVPFITAKHVKEKIDFENCYFVTQEVHDTIYSRCNPEFGDVLVVNIGVGCGTSALVNVDFEFSMKNVALLKTSKDLRSGFVHYYLQENRKSIYQSVTQGGAQAFLSLKTLKKIIIPLPSVSIQQEIVAQIEAEQEMVNGNKKLIEIYEQKVKDKIGDVWGE